MRFICDYHKKQLRFAWFTLEIVQQDTYTFKPGIWKIHQGLKTMPYEERIMEAGAHGFYEYYPKSSYFVSVCKGANGDLKGSIKTFSLPGTVLFTSSWGMLKAIAEDAGKNPAFRLNELHHWQGIKTPENSSKKTALQPQMPDKPSCTFLVALQFCRGATWQGSIQWMEGKQTRMFRSEYEMLYLIEQAMSEL